MKRNSSAQDSDSDNDIWNYKTARSYKQVKNKQPVSAVNLQNPYGVKPGSAIDGKYGKI